MEPEGGRGGVGGRRGGAGGRQGRSWRAVGEAPEGGREGAGEWLRKVKKTQGRGRLKNPAAGFSGVLSVGRGRGRSLHGWGTFLNLGEQYEINDLFIYSMDLALPQ